jgi:hypothetical protein
MLQTRALVVAVAALTGVLYAQSPPATTGGAMPSIAPDLEKPAHFSPRGCSHLGAYVQAYPAAVGGPRVSAGAASR